MPPRPKKYRGKASNLTLCLFSLAGFDPQLALKSRPGPIYLNEKNLKNEVHLLVDDWWLSRCFIHTVLFVLNCMGDRHSKLARPVGKSMSITTRAYSLSRLKRTQPLNQHFFFSPSSSSFRLLPPRATATWPRGLVRWQVPPERHMRIVFTCASLSTRSQFCCNL